MLRIEKDSEECLTKLKLSGRIQSEHISSIQSELGNDCPHKILDLSEVTLVDLAVVQFLIRCEDEGIAIVQCPPWVGEWLLLERAEQ